MRSLPNPIPAEIGTCQIQAGIRKAARGKWKFKPDTNGDMDTLGRISTTFKEKGEILDPHTAIGVEGAYRFASSASMESDLSIVSLACAHPAKFPDAVQKATGASPELPVHLKDLLTRKERLTVLPNSIQQVSSYIAANSRVEVA